MEKMDQCLVFRTHKFDVVDQNQILLLKDQLSVTNNFDIIITLNVKTMTSGKEIISQWRDFCEKHKTLLAVFSEDIMITKFPSYKGAWLHAQYSFTETFSQYPKYKYYWFWEYDLRFNGNFSDLVIEHDKDTKDLLGTHVGSYKSSPTWFVWFLPDTNFEFALEERYKYFAALTRASNKFMHVLNDQVGKTYGMIEPYVATICVKYLGTLSIGDFDKKYWTGDTVRYSPIFGDQDHYETHIVNDPQYKDKLLHPVKPEPKQ